MEDVKRAGEGVRGVMKKIIVLMLLSFIGVQSFAKCEPNIINQDDLYKLDDTTLSLNQVYHQFGLSCFGGYNAITMQFKDENNDDVWFWFDNKPIPAAALIYTENMPSMKIAMIVKKQSDVEYSEQIIWPVELRDTDFSQALTEFYFD